MSSEQLADGVNPLDAELAATWDVLKGYSGRDTDLGIARRFGGSSAAYSLRDFGAMNDSVVRVRREPYDTTVAIDDEERFSANQVQDGTLERWVNGELESTLPADVDTAAAAYSLRKVKADYGAPTTKLDGTDGFPSNLNSLPLGNFSNAISGSTFTVGHFSTNFSAADSVSLSLGNNSFTLRADKATSGAQYGHVIRVQGLSVGKRYTVTGEFRVIKGNGSGGVKATVDISDATSGTDETSIETANTTFTPFEVTALFNDADAGKNFIDFTLNDFSQGGNAGSGPIEGEFRNIKIVESDNRVVRLRRSSDNVEVDVDFDTEGKLSTSSLVGDIAEQGGESGSTTATDLNGFLNETLDDKFSPVTYPDDIASNFRQWNTLTATSNSFSATTGTVDSNNARFCYALPSALSASDGGITTFRISGTVDYTTSTGSGNGFFIKLNQTTDGSNSFDFGSISLTGVGTIQVNKLRFNHGDNGDFSIDVTGNGANILRSILFSQTEVTSGTTSISFTNLKFEIIKHGATVHTWYDQAGSNDAVQETASSQPKIAESGALLTDGIDFDGTNHFLSTSSSFSLTSSDDLSFFTVYKPDVTNAILTVLSQEDGTGTGRAWLSLRSNADISTFIGGTGKVLFTSGSTTNEMLTSLIYDDSASTINGFKNAVNGTQATSITAEAASGSLNIGESKSSNERFDGTMKEIIVYLSDQTDNRFKIESNINNYYGLYNDENEFSANPVAAGAASAAITLTNVSKTGFTAEIDATSGTKQVNIDLLNSMASGDDYFVSFDYTSTNTGNTVGVKPRTAALGSASNDVISATNSGFYGGTGDANHNGFDINNTATVLSFQTTNSNFTFTVSNLKASRIARNGFVETWYDQSGNSRDMEQDTAAYQPAIVKNGNICKTANGYKTISFDGSDDYLVALGYSPAADSEGGMTDFNITCVTGKPPSSTQKAITSMGSQEGSHVIGGFYFSNNINSVDSTKQDIRFNISEHDITTPTTTSHIDQKIISGTALYDTNLLSFNRRGSDNTFEFFNPSPTGTTLTGTSLIPKCGQTGENDDFKVGASMFNNASQRQYQGDILEVMLFDSSDKRDDAPTINSEIEHYYNI